MLDVRCCSPLHEGELCTWGGGAGWWKDCLHAHVRVPPIPKLKVRITIKFMCNFIVIFICIFVVIYRNFCCNFSSFFVDNESMGGEQDGVGGGDQGGIFDCDSPYDADCLAGWDEGNRGGTSGATQGESGGNNYDKLYMQFYCNL